MPSAAGKFLAPGVQEVIEDLFIVLKVHRNLKCQRVSCGVGRAGRRLGTDNARHSVDFRVKRFRNAQMGVVFTGKLVLMQARRLGLASQLATLLHEDLKVRHVYVLITEEEHSTLGGW